jgi:hypothetical protein
LTVFKTQGRDHTTQEGDLLFGAVQEGDVHVRATDCQRYPRDTNSGAEIEYAHTRQEKVTLGKVQRLHDEHIEHTRSAPQSREVEMRTPVQQKC